MNGRTAPIALLLALCAALCCACAGPRVVVNYDPAADFASYRTYGFSTQLATDDGDTSTLLSKFLKAAASRELEARGYTADDEPDLVVNFNVSTEQKTQVTQSPSAYYGYRRYGWGMGGVYDTSVRHYTEGTLHVDLIDRARNELVWEGAVIGIVDGDVRDNLQQAVDDALEQAFAEYPFTAGSGEPRSAR